MLRNFEDIYFEDYLQTAASESKAEFAQSMQFIQSVAKFISKLFQSNCLSGCFSKCNIFKHNSDDVAFFVNLQKSTFLSYYFWD